MFACACTFVRWRDLIRHQQQHPSTPITHQHPSPPPTPTQRSLGMQRLYGRLRKRAVGDNIKKPQQPITQQDNVAVVVAAPLCRLNWWHLAPVISPKSAPIKNAENLNAAVVAYVRPFARSPIQQFVCKRVFCIRACRVCLLLCASATAHARARARARACTCFPLSLGLFHSPTTSCSTSVFVLADNIAPNTHARTLARKTQRSSVWYPGADAGRAEARVGRGRARPTHATISIQLHRAGACARGNAFGT